jgi:hypothetical protein
MTVKTYKWQSKHNSFIIVYYFRATCFDSLESFICLYCQWYELAHALKPRTLQLTWLEAAVGRIVCCHCRRRRFLLFFCCCCRRHRCSHSCEGFCGKVTLLIDVICYRLCDQLLNFCQGHWKCFLFVTMQRVVWGPSGLPPRWGWVPFLIDLGSQNVKLIYASDAESNIMLAHTTSLWHLMWGVSIHAFWCLKHQKWGVGEVTAI